MLLTITRHRETESRTGTFLRVLVLDLSDVATGRQDVTDRCAAADDRYGWALVYRLDAEGRKYFDRETGRPAMDVLVGDVIFDGTRGRDAR